MPCNEQTVELGMSPPAASEQQEDAGSTGGEPAGLQQEAGSHGAVEAGTPYEPGEEAPCQQPAEQGVCEPDQQLEQQPQEQQQYETEAGSEHQEQQLAFEPHAPEEGAAHCEAPPTEHDDGATQHEEQQHTAQEDESGEKTQPQLEETHPQLSGQQEEQQGEQGEEVPLMEEEGAAAGQEEGMPAPLSHLAAVQPAPEEPAAQQPAPEEKEEEKVAAEEEGVEGEADEEEEMGAGDGPLEVTSSFVSADAAPDDALAAMQLPHYSSPSAPWPAQAQYASSSASYHQQQEAEGHEEEGEEVAQSYALPGEELLLGHGPASEASSGPCSAKTEEEGDAPPPYTLDAAGGVLPGSGFPAYAPSSPAAATASSWLGDSIDLAGLPRPGTGRSAAVTDLQMQLAMALRAREEAAGQLAEQRRQQEASEVTMRAYFEVMAWVLGCSRDAYHLAARC